MTQQMFLKPLVITPDSIVTDIVKLDYRLADVFRKYGIEYCCADNCSLHVACTIKEIETTKLIKELEDATQNPQLLLRLPFHSWEIDFLINYIINIHHCYLRLTLPDLKAELEEFTEKHREKYPYYEKMVYYFRRLEKDILPHITQEEEEIFPYLKQVAHAYKEKGNLGKLFVRALRKPILSIMNQEHQIIGETLYQFRQFTDYYEFPETACATHFVILSKLKAIDNDLVQHIYLENNVLFPRVIDMEKEILSNS